ncbi:MAG: signal peptide peptidase SppA [bacterium]|nr:signal peptide peptidase SppA [bacterium]
MDNINQPNTNYPQQQQAHAANPASYQQDQSATNAPPQSPQSANQAASNPPKKKTSTCLILFMIVLILALLASLGGNFILFVAAAANGSGKVSTDTESFKETLLDGDASAAKKIVVIPITGEIFDTSVSGMSSSTFSTPDRMHSVLKSLREDDKLTAIILDINSPGGGVTASDKIYHELDLFKKQTKIPIVSLFEDLACSGGYYSAMASDHIVAHSTTFTGSIGVIMQTAEVSELLDNIGVEMNTITSLNNKGKPSYKDMGSPFRKMRPDERAMFQEMITQAWERFTDVVAEGRKGKLTKEEVRALADGRVLTSRQALKAKLIDSIGYQEDAFAKARELSKAPDACVVKITRTESFRDILYGVGASSYGKLPALLEQSPRLKFLWTGKAL